MLLDECDLDLLKLKMHRHTAGYLVINEHLEERYVHRVVLSRKLGRKLDNGEMCDHINQNKLDNRRQNLRLADKSLNSVNRNKRPDNSSGYVGVYLYHPKQWQERGWARRWRYSIQRKGKKTKYSPYYKTPEDANTARLEELKNYDY